MTHVRRTAAFAGAAVVSGAVAVAVAGGAGGSARPERPLIFDDEFNGSRLDQSRWGTCYWWGGCTITTNHEQEWYEARQVRVGDGAARLVAAPRTAQAGDGHTYPYVSGMIDSGPPPGSKVPKFAFRYGRLEARIRVPPGRGLWSALWLLPANRSDLPEIDALEILGRDPRAVQMHLHYRAPDGSEAVKGSTWRALRPAGGWHRYEIDWRRGRLRWLIDGVLRWQVTGAAVPSTPMYVIANLAVGGGPAGAPGPATAFPSAMEIDWIRISR